MKALILFIALSLCLLGCKKDVPEGYYPKVGDTQKSVIDHWGITKEVVKFSPAFNDDVDYTYRGHSTVVRIISARVDKVSKIKD